MKNLSVIALLCVLVLGACKKNEPTTANSVGDNKVLLVKIDYLTNEFEGGKVLNFQQSNTGFTTSIIDTPATDFGSIKIMYNEVSQPIFYGTIVWMGLGEMKYPNPIAPASDFTNVLTNDYRTPYNGFENLNNAYAPNQNFEMAWARAQAIQEVRNYLDSNPTQVVKVFLYTPSVGVGNPADWDWIFFLKN